MGKAKFTKKQVDGEPQYVEFSSRKKWKVNQHQKWQEPEPGSLQERLLNTCFKKYYSTQQEKDLMDDIASSCRPLSEGPSTYPLEWVNEMIIWVEKKRAGGDLLGIPALVGAIKNEERKQDFLAKKAREEWLSSKTEPKDQRSSPSITTGRTKTRQLRRQSSPGEPPLE